jgi:hypothetical protein
MTDNNYSVGHAVDDPKREVFSIRNALPSFNSRPALVEPRSNPGDRLADSRAIFIEAVRKASIEADRPSLAEALCGLAQAERAVTVLFFPYRAAIPKKAE